MSYQTKSLGSQGEQLAADFLVTKKYKILQRNMRTRFGEIDILAKDGRTLAVVEVKTKTSERFGSALEMITPAKQQKLVLLTHELQSRYQVEAVRIDVVAIDQAGEQPVIKLHKGIIEYHT